MVLTHCREKAMATAQEVEMPGLPGHTVQEGNKAQNGHGQADMPPGQAGRSTTCLFPGPKPQESTDTRGVGSMTSSEVSVL